jgi:signal transduction histidine kinase
MDWYALLGSATLTPPARHTGATTAGDSVQNRLRRLAFERVERPQMFFDASTSGHIAYGETVAAFLVGLPNAALQMAVRCLELALQEQYLAVERREPTVELPELIHWAEDHLAGRSAAFKRFESLVQLAHRHRSVDEHELLTPLTTIRDVTALLNEFYPLPTDVVTQQLLCPLCGTTHTHAIPRRAYYLGNIINVPCEQSRMARGWLIDWQ